jgi:hypothetical protein
MDSVTKDRDRYIGGSDLPKLMTSSNLYKLAKEKLNYNFEGNEYTHYGQFMEPIIRNYLNQQHDYSFKPDTKFKGIYRANCDGICPTGKLLEIKTRGANIDVMKYLPQVQGYLNIFEVNTCILASYNRPDNFFTWGDITDRQSYNLEFDPQRLELFKIHRDLKTWEKIDYKARKFYKGLQALRHNQNLSERDFNIIVYGKRLVEAVEQNRETKYLEKLCAKEHITKAEIGDALLTCNQVSEIVLDNNQPKIFEMKRKTEIKIRRKRINVT